ncbi:two-component sensor histidine kinase [Trinickia terrae]|uniref:histidine kinase n=1 Tax=Trinickia terrae TaxID=2571161 RepID=A0A4U1HJV9_9BURK|nr:ATP-binding protein [Trinickia terrae]TKC81485.1 two-component sensor histidine kinase [Trinickia terrae]
MIRATPSRLSPYRYCKWRWLRFRRSWTDTRADRVPSWSRLYLRVYLHLLGMVLLIVAAMLAALSLTLPPGSLRHVVDSMPAAALAAFAVFGLPALAAYRWVRPIWHDLVIIRERATDFTGGRFNTRARESHSVLIGPLARMLNRLAERMERLIAAQRDLTNGISHELRTPLARARFALEILREPSSAHEYETAIASIEQDIAELDELIAMSLTYARLEYLSLQSQLEPAPLAAWFGQQMREASLLCGGKTLKIEADVDRSARVAMDTRLMSYAIRNLLRNAGKYANSQILVTVAIVRGNVEIAVEDDGAGVAPAAREQIFDAFVRLDRTTGGYGLGLAITRQVLQAHQGRIVATDPLTLTGARFELSWPVSKVA